MAQIHSTDAEQDVQQVVTLMFAMLTENPATSIHDVRGRNDQQGWNYTVRYGSRDYPDDAATPVEGMRLSPDQLDEAWAKAKRMHAVNEFAWM